MRNPFGRGALVGLLAALVIVPSLWAHPDDPKERDREPFYDGPGWRSGMRGTPPPFLSKSTELLAWITIPEFGNSSTSANDCWGYMSPSGREYAIIGLSRGTAFVEITNPGLPVITAVLAGPTSSWRDIKTYQDYAYAVSEGGSGIQVFDLSAIDSGTVTHVRNVLTGGTSATHNVVLNTDSGFLYRSGGGNNGLRIYSLSNPANPVFVSSWPDRYVHDAQVVSYTSGPYAGREIAFCCSGFNGGGTQTGVDILDVTDKQNIINLSRLIYAGGRYSHQAWLSADRQFLYLNDELDEGNVNGVVTTTKTFVIDVSDLANPFVADTFTNGSRAIGHNLYTKGNILYEANYRSGLHVFDATDPFDVFEVAFFDTYPDNNMDMFNGAWNVYPYFSNDVVIVSDIERGLFVIRVNPFTPAFTYPTGLPELAWEEYPTPFVVEIGAPESAVSATLHARINGGPFTSTGMTSLGGNQFGGDLPSIGCPGEVEYYISADFADPSFSYTDPPDAPEHLFTAAPVAHADLTVEMDDDFEQDQGWTVINGGGLSEGAWERTTPVPNAGHGNPPGDFDGSGQCFVTMTGEGNTDVDGGTTTLVSPEFNLNRTDGVVRYARWYTNDYNANAGTDEWLVEVTNDGTNWVEVERTSLSSGWIVQSFVVSSYVEPSRTMQVRFTASDLGPLNSVVEAAVDAFSVMAFDCFACPFVAGDVDLNCSVNLVDFAAFSLCFGRSGPGANCSAEEFAGSDLDGNGAINLIDFAVLALNFGG